MPLDFVYNKEENEYDLSRYATDADLLAKVQSGKGDLAIFEGNKFLFIEGIFAETEPEVVEQQMVLNAERPFGQNNLKKAKAAKYTYYIQQARQSEFNEEAFLGFEQKLTEAVDEWSETTKAANFILYTGYGYRESWQEDVLKDLISVVVAAGAVAIYIALFLGSFSPMHCRCTVALVGTISVLLSFFSGFGLLYYCGQQTSTFHLWLPFLLMCISVEHMFIICSSIDQTNLELSAYTRVHEAFSHSGPSITITSLATCLAFAFGMFCSLEALKSFCLFAATCVAMNWLCTMTIFSAAVVWDTRRVQEKQNECFGWCSCKETSILCCGGRLASIK